MHYAALSRLAALRRPGRRSQPDGVVEPCCAAAPLGGPSAGLSLRRRTFELLSDNLGQPGFGELCIIRARHGRCGAISSLRSWGVPTGSGFSDGPRRRTTPAARFQMFDLSGAGARARARRARGGALALPVATGPPPRLPRGRGEGKRTGCALPGCSKRWGIAGAEQVTPRQPAPPSRPARTSSAPDAPIPSRPRRGAACGVRNPRPPRRARALRRTLRGLFASAVTRSARWIPRRVRRAIPGAHTHSLAEPTDCGYGGCVPPVGPADRRGPGHCIVAVQSANGIKK